jgi:hypothetical protein
MRAIELVVGISSPTAMMLWEQICSGVDGVEVVMADPPGLFRLQGLDAVLLPPFLAHDRYGGILEPGRSRWQRGRAGRRHGRDSSQIWFYGQRRTN